MHRAPWLIWIPVVLLTSSAAATEREPATARLEVRVVSKAGATMPRAGQLVFRSTTNQIVKVPLVGSETVQFTALPRSSWSYHVEAAGAWSVEGLQVMGEAGSTTAATLAIWPTSTLTGTYVLPKDKGDGPKSLSIRLAQPPSSSRVEFPEGSVGCQLDANRGWSCEVPAPAVPIDIAIHAAGFVPVYMWGVAVTGGSRKAMGPIALRPGASVAGWLATEDGSPLAARTEAL